MKKIKELFKNSFFIFIIAILNLILMVYFLTTVKEIHKDHIIIIIFGLIPSIVFFIVAYFINKNSKKDKTTKIVINIISIFSMVPYIIYMSIWLFLFTLIISIHPYKKISSYERYNCINYFPKKIPNNYIKASYYNSRFITSNQIILYLKLDYKSIEKYKNKLNKRKPKLNRNKDMDDYLSKFYMNTPYETKFLDKDFILYTIKSDCDDSGYCNHGLDKHIVINEKTNEIIFYYENW